MRRTRIPVIDLFAGPGGLGEGFSSIRDSSGGRVFQTIMSIEMETNARTTLRLRAFFRRIYDVRHEIPSEYLDYMAHQDVSHLEALKQAFPAQWEAADKEAVQATLKKNDNSLAYQAKQLLAAYKGDQYDLPSIIIGGPPCQAYSLVGRSRRAHEQEKLQKDVKQTLYVAYLNFVRIVQPDIFVMENVKGLLSAKLHEDHVFSLIRQDVANIHYTLHSLVVPDPEKPSDFVVHAENYGVPQARHRIILVGIRNDLTFRLPTLVPYTASPVTVKTALVGMPKVRSSISHRSKSVMDEQWADYILRSSRELSALLSEPSDISGITNIDPEIRSAIVTKLHNLQPCDLPTATSASHINSRAFDKATDNPLRAWYRSRLERAHSNQITSDHARSHMASDLDRYLFSSVFASVTGHPAKLADFPAELLPHHQNLHGKNLKEVEFNDRFRTQLADRPSTTVTSHIAKDGHYFIHPDFTQVRSLTVREAARLQTFPDDYVFEGNRTSQYQQVGNAVPPLLANQIAACVASALGRPAQNYFEEQTPATRA